MREYPGSLRRPFYVRGWFRMVEGPAALRNKCHPTVPLEPRKPGASRFGIICAVDEVEARALKALEEKLLNQKLFEEFCDEFTREMNPLWMQHRASLSAAGREIERI